MANKRKNKRNALTDRDAVAEAVRPKGDALQNARRQIQNVAKVAGVAAIVIWLLALGFRSGLDSWIPIYVAATLTVAGLVGAFFIRRNLHKSEAFGALVSDASNLSGEEKADRIAKLDAKVDKGDSAAILAKAQILMQDDPRAALEALERADLNKGPKAIAHQVRAMRCMIHLNLGEVQNARALSEDIDLSKLPDAKLRANLSAVVAEAWARSGNSIEAQELLDKYDADDSEFEDVRVQLLRARAFVCAHRQDIAGMRRSIKALIAISPQLAGMFVGQKRIHPLLNKEAMKLLQKSGFAPKQKIQMIRR